MSDIRTLLVVWHSASGGTSALVQAAVTGASDPAISQAGSQVQVRMIEALHAGVEDVLGADGYLLATPENFGYMSGALKDFFDRTYYPCLDRTRGRPYRLVVKAGGDGAGAVGAVLPLATGLGWRSVGEPLVVQGQVSDEDLESAKELGGALAAGLALDLW